MRARPSPLTLAAAAAASLALLPAAATAQYLGPSPYRGAGDSPFTSLVFSSFYIETMEDGLFNATGASKSAGAVLGPAGLTDSVDEDDGTLDGCSDVLVVPAWHAACLLHNLQSNHQVYLQEDVCASSRSFRDASSVSC